MKKSARKITKIERIIYIVTITLLIFAPITVVFTKSALSEINYKVEKIKKTIATQEKTNESLQMKINELASLDNIQNIIKEEGLSYNDSNVKNVN